MIKQCFCIYSSENALPRTTTPPNIEAFIQQIKQQGRPTRNNTSKTVTPTVSSSNQMNTRSQKHQHNLPSHQQIISGMDSHTNRSGTSSYNIMPSWLLLFSWIYKQLKNKSVLNLVYQNLKTHKQIMKLSHVCPHCQYSRRLCSSPTVPTLEHEIACFRV